MFYGYYFSSVFNWIWNTPQKNDECPVQEAIATTEEAVKDCPQAETYNQIEKDLATEINEAMLAAISDPPPPKPVVKPVASLPMRVVCKKKQPKWNKHHIH